MSRPHSYSQGLWRVWLSIGIGELSFGRFMDLVAAHG